MTFYERMAATATRLLRERGQNLALRRLTAGGDYDPATGTGAPGVPVDLPTVGLFRDFTEEWAATSQIMDGDRMAVLDASQMPLLTDRLIAGNDVLTIVKIKPINPAGTPVAYRLQVRG
jgi:hypothetical protein